jgi:acyl-CoA thioesterase-1
MAPRVKRRAVALLVAAGALMLPALPGWAEPATRPVKIVVLGDSLTAGLGLGATDAFPAKLQRALTAKGLKVEIINAGVSGDTAAGGLARLDWSVPDGTDAAIVELGANDALRGLEPKTTAAALGSILTRLKERHIPVLLAGMRAPRNLGEDYGRAFDQVFADLAARNDVVFYPFFLEGVAAVPNLNQPDGIHPTAAGVDVIVANILTKVEQLIARVHAK